MTEFLALRLILAWSVCVVVTCHLWFDPSLCKYEQRRCVYKQNTKNWKPAVVLLFFFLSFLSPLSVFRCHFAFKQDFQTFYNCSLFFPFSPTCKTHVEYKLSWIVSLFIDLYIQVFGVSFCFALYILSFLGYRLIYSCIYK